MFALVPWFITPLPLAPLGARYAMAGYHILHLDHFA
jgi:hypothetical protein